MRFSGATGRIRTSGLPGRRTTTGRYRPMLKREFCWFCTVAPRTIKSPLLVVTTGFFGILQCGCTVVVKWWSIIEEHISQLCRLILPRVNHIGDVNAEISLINPEIDIIILHYQAADAKVMPRLLRGKVDTSGKHLQGINRFLQCAQQFHSGLRRHQIDCNIACDFLHRLLGVWSDPYVIQLFHFQSLRSDDRTPHRRALTGWPSPVYIRLPFGR